MISLVLSLFLSFAHADSMVISEFCGLKNSVDSTVIEQCGAQDALNVELNRTGTGLKKRDGYAQFLTLSTASTQVSSSFGFKNNSGTELLLFTHNNNLYRSANQATAVFVSTLAVGARLNCVSADGQAYCFTSSQNVPFKYDGTSYISIVANSYPQGKGSCLSQDRQVVFGVSGLLNRLYFSQSGAIETFTAGNLDTSAWTEDVGVDGDAITACKWLNGRLIVFKEYGIQGANCTDQFNCQFYDISKRVGIPGPESIIVHEGINYFKGSDNRFYAIDASPGGVVDIGTDISSTTAQILSGKVRSNVQTTQADWQDGTLTQAGPGAPISAVITPGSVEPSSITFLDTSDDDFVLGTLTNLQYAAGSLTMSTSTVDNFTDGDVTGSPAWTQFGAANATVSNGEVTSVSGSAAAIRTPYTVAIGTFTIDYRLSSNYTGARAWFWPIANSCSSASGSFCDGYFVRVSNNAGVMYIDLTRQKSSTDCTMLIPATGSYSCESTVGTSLGSYNSTRHKIKLIRSSAGAFQLYHDSTYIGSATDTNMSTSTIVATKVDGDTVFVDSVTAPSTSGDIVSRTFDTAFTTPTWGSVVVDMSSTTASPLTIQTQVSADAASWESLVTETNTSKITSIGRRYLRYKLNYTVGVSSEVPTVNSVTLIGATTGQYLTSCIEPGPGITDWGALESAGTNTCGSVAFSISTGATCGTVGGTYFNQSTGTTITAIGVGAAAQVKFTYSLNSATCTARVDSLTVNWTEGAVSSPTYGAYWNDGLYWTVQTAGSVNNRTLKYDLLNKQWFPFDIGANALLNFNNIFYFGSTANGKVYKFSNIQPSQAPTSDDGANINAYWKSKDFGGSNPFTEHVYENISTVMKKQSGGTATVDWQLNGGATNSGSYSVSLSTGDNVVRNNYSMPFGQIGTFLNLKVSNNSTIPFEILGIKFDFTPQPWRELPQ